MVTKRKSSTRRKIQRTRTRSTSLCARGSPRKEKEIATLRLLFRRRPRRRIRQHETAAGWQRRKSPRNDAHRSACAARDSRSRPKFAVTFTIITAPTRRNSRRRSQRRWRKSRNRSGKKFGDKERPLLVSVRSGARDSMPGMMDTILNLGMNDEVVEIVANKTNNARFAWDSYRRFLQMYGDVVMGVQKRPGEEHEPFESGHRAPEGRALRQTRFSRRQIDRRGFERTRAAFQSADQRAHRKIVSRRIRTNSFGAQSARYSVPG